MRAVPCLNNHKISRKEENMGKKGKEKKTALKKYKKSASYLKKGAKSTQKSK
jgi:hypothetical protein